MNFVFIFGYQITNPNLWGSSDFRVIPSINQWMSESLRILFSSRSISNYHTPEISTCIFKLLQSSINFFCLVLFKCHWGRGCLQTSWDLCVCGVGEADIKERKQCTQCQKFYFWAKIAYGMHELFCLKSLWKLLDSAAVGCPATAWQPWRVKPNRLPGFGSNEDNFSSYREITSTLKSLNPLQNFIERHVGNNWTL